MAKRKVPPTVPLPRVPRVSWAIAALVATSLLLYWGSLRDPLVFDDIGLSNALLRRFAGGGGMFDLRWLSHASFGWIYAAFGADWLWQRAANVLLHAAVAATLFLFLRRLFAEALSGGPAWPVWYALFGAAFFVAHPVAVYGVAYLIQRSIVLATLLSLLSLRLFLEGMLRGGRAWFLGAAALYLAAVFCKEHAVMLPAVAGALALMLRRPAWPGLPALARELALPFALYGIIAVSITLRAKGVLGQPYEPLADVAVRGITAGAPPAAGGQGLWPLSVLNQAWLFFRYFATWLLPWPGWMSIDLRPAFPSQLLSWPHTAGFAAWLAWPALGSALLFRRGGAGLAGLAMLAPWLLSLTEFVTVRVQEPFVLYRSYLWMFLLPAAVPAVAGRLPARPRAACLAAICFALLLPQQERLASFGTEIGLWDDAVRKLPEPPPPFAARALRNRGVAYFRTERFSEAKRDFDAALGLDPGDPASWIARGSLYLRTDESGKALEDFDRAISLGVDDARHGSVYALRCRLLGGLGRSGEALNDCLKAVQVDAGSANSFVSLGMVRASRGETALAESAFLRALELDPGYGMARYQYGLMLGATGRRGDAQRMLAGACAAGLPEACARARALGVPR
ncbi:MAG TPA: tetratricopeptide repeat protein [Burkholderiales bacterium]|nr:tetratricopeptide repeat protein [Burkholderiales bacterium]